MIDPDAGVEVTQAAKFWAKVDKRGKDECWLWLGGMGSTGSSYGRSYLNGKMRPATQVSWEIANGRSFPAGMKACHSCDNPPCVNPRHIWPGTQSDNLKDCVEKGRHASKPLVVCQRGHGMAGGNRIPTTGGFRCRECARLGTRERMRAYRNRRKNNG